MKQVLEQRKVTLIVTVLLFLLIFSFGGAVEVCNSGDGGIADPTDPLNPESPPPGGGGDSLSNNLVILYGAMDLIL